MIVVSAANFSRILFFQDTYIQLRAAEHFTLALEMIILILRGSADERRFGWLESSNIHLRCKNCL